MRRPRAHFAPPVAIDRDAHTPLYQQIYDWFRAAIASGQLHPGQRVPSTRTLADELHVSRIPVLNAFEQLRAEGYLETVVGSGTLVARSIPVRRAPPTARQRRRRPPQLSRRAAAIMALPSDAIPRDPVAFRMNLPALDQFPHAVWSKLLRRHARSSPPSTMMYGDPLGFPPLRQAIAEYVGAARGVRCDPSRILVTAGSQHALQIAAHVLLDAGDSVWIEDPGYPGAHRALLMAGARLVPVPVDHDGLVVDDGIRLAPTARAAYVTPSHQYPLGATMSAARRMQLQRWAARAEGWIIEDDYDSEYRFGGKPIAALQGLDPDDRVIYVGTFSKVLFPALRLGYVVLPEDLVAPFAVARDAADIFSPTFYQAVLADFIADGHFARHIRRSRALYRERRAVAIDALSAELGDVLEIVGSDAGMHIVALIPPGLSDTAVCRQAARHSVAALPLSNCALRPLARGGLILGFGGTTPPQIRAAARRLALAMKASS
jgi:GntR family transcriptional regulator / MocR family aminotransferase